MRIANVYGPGQRAELEGGVVAIFSERLLAGLPVVIHGDGEQRRDFIFVQDVVEAILAIAGSPATGTWNVSTGQATSINELLAHLGRIVDTPPTSAHATARAGDLRMSCLDPTKAGVELGWKSSYSLADGLRATLAPVRRSSEDQGPA